MKCILHESVFPSSTGRMIAHGMVHAHAGLAFPFLHESHFKYLCTGDQEAARAVKLSPADEPDVEVAHCLDKVTSTIKAQLGISSFFCSLFRPKRNFIVLSRSMKNSCCTCNAKLWHACCVQANFKPFVSTGINKLQCLSPPPQKKNGAQYLRDR